MPELRLNNIAYRYPEAESDVFSGVDLALRPGRPVWIEGRNGAGKTTLLEVLAGLRRPSHGTVTWDDAEVPPGTATYIPTEPPVVGELDADEHTGLVAGLWNLEGERHRRYAARVAGLRMQVGLDAGKVPVGSYSEGMKDKLSFCLLYALETPVLLMDEPFTSLDAEALAVCQHLVRERAASAVVVLSSHAAPIAAPLEPERVQIDRLVQAGATP